MKNILFACTFALLGSVSSRAQNSQDLTRITAAIQTFSRAADQQDASALDGVLHPQYRAVVHRVFGSSDLSLMDKSLYLQLIRDKKIGGDTRDIHLLEVDVVHNIAQVRAVLQGKALRFQTYISLVKLEDGTWQIISDMPDITKA
jgi:Putative lumazine-binding